MRSHGAQEKERFVIEKFRQLSQERRMADAANAKY